MTAWADDQPRRLVQASSAFTVICAAAALAVTCLSTAWLAPLFDPDEGYYPATAAESVDAGCAWDPRFNGAPRWDKPIFTYAAIEASFATFGRTVPAARLPSIIEGALLVLVVGFVVEQLAGHVAAGLAAWILATTVGVQIFARVAHPEIGVVLMIATAELLAVRWLVMEEPGARRRTAVLGGLVLGLGVLAKGPVAVVLPALAVATCYVLMHGRVRPSATAVRHLLACAAIAAAVALPWYIAMTWRHGSHFLDEAVWRHNVGRFAGEAFVHRSPPWFFVLPTLVAMFPWSGLVPGALFGVSRSAREPKEVLRFFMLIGLATSFVFYSASGSKLPHYALVFVPPLSILIALRLSDQPQDRRVSGVEWLAAMMLMVTLVFAIAPLLINRVVGAREILSGLPGSGPDLTTLFGWALWPAAGLLFVTAMALTAARARALTTLATAGALLPAMLIVGAQPLLARAYPWEKFGPLIRGAEYPVWMIGPRAPSLTFYSGHTVTRLSESEADRWTLPTRDAWIVADTVWLSRRLVNQPDRRWERRETFGGMTLMLWHGEDVSDSHLK
jgi:4-amino-4-deoxy-L-arabinose transferase-like glycosyltransferase